MEAEAENNKRKMEHQDQLSRRRYEDQSVQNQRTQEEILKKQEELVAKQETMRKATLEHKMEMRAKADTMRIEAGARVKVERENQDLTLEQPPRPTASFATSVQPPVQHHQSAEKVSQPLVHAANLPDEASLEPVDRAQEVRPCQQGDPDHAEDHLRQAGHHEGALQEERKQRAQGADTFPDILQPPSDLISNNNLSSSSTSTNNNDSNNNTFMRGRGRPKGRTWHKCEDCGYTTLRKSILNHHKDCRHGHTNVKRKNEAKCRYCNKTSRYKSNITRHEKYSCEERPRVLKKLTPSKLWRIGKTFKLKVRRELVFSTFFFYQFHCPRCQIGQHLPI